jgi:protein O-GlcNAc transferase
MFHIGNDRSLWKFKSPWSFLVNNLLKYHSQLVSPPGRLQLNCLPQNPRHDPGLRGKQETFMNSRKTDRHKQQAPSPQEINLLVTLFAQGRYAEAMTLAQMMTVRFPQHGFAWMALGKVLKRTGRGVAALAAMQKAAALLPNLVEAHFNLGTALHELGRLSEAEASYQRALQIKPDFAEVHNDLGAVLHELDRLNEAEASYRRALQIKPDFAEVYNNLANALKELGRLGEAEASYRRALQIKPDFAELHNNLGEVLKELGRLDEAEASYRRALQIKPDYPQAHNNLGTALQALGRLDEAEASYRQALRIKPDFAEVYINLGAALHELGRLDEAEASYRRALQIKPDFAEAHNNLANALKELGRLDEAEASYRRALQIKPDFAEAHNNLGEALKELGRPDEAEASYRRALQIKSDYAEAHSNLLFALNYHSDKPDEAVFRAHQEYEIRFGIPHRGEWLCHNNAREGFETGRRLRVGYVSPDLRQHSVAYFFQPLLREHDPQAVEVFCYAELARPDAVTSALRGFADHWLSTVGLSDAALAERIAADEIDILVDLAGHTAKNRLPVFARKPAPVQITWLGYPNTTGLSAMDYRLVDAVTDPPGEADRWASETLIRLDDGFLCYEPPADAPLPVAPPSLANGGITFGSFNNPAKLSSATLDAWAMLLERVPGSRFLAKGRGFAEDATRAAFLARLVQRGVDPQRVTLLGYVHGLAHHLAVYEQVDIALDPFPYNGTTTTCEAMWMGVPVVTLLGDRHAGRVGASLLTQVGLTDLIAPSVEAYIDIASALAADPARLAALRHTMRERLSKSPLCAPQAFARKIEAIYRDLWQRHCASVDASQLA